MRYLIKCLVGLLCIVAAISPVSAILTNQTNPNTVLISNSFAHDSNYMPTEYVYVLIIIGLACLIISRVFEQAEDIFSIGAVLPLALSAWWANYMTIEHTKEFVINNVTTVINTQIIAPNPYLSLCLAVLFLCSLANVIWVFSLKDADKKTGDG